MINSSKSGPTRRQLLAGGGALAMTTLASTRVLSNSQKGARMKLAIVGTGSRGSRSWGKPVVDSYSDVVELVGLCDHNGKRVEAAKKLMGTQCADLPGLRSDDQRNAARCSDGHDRRFRARTLHHSGHGAGLRRHQREAALHR